jgi:hypothetical protein
MLNQNNPQDNTEIVYFSHGGGPLPILGDTSHKAMVDFMVQLPARLRKSICCHFMCVKPATQIFDDYILGKRAVAFLW